MRLVPTSDADRLTAVLRLLVAPIVLVGEAVSSADPDPGELVDEVVVMLAGGLALYALAVLLVVRRPARPAVFDVVLPVVDIAFAVGLGLASGGAFSLFSLIFLFAPATTAFQLRPRHTAIVTVISLSAYFVHGVGHPSSTRPGALAELVARTIYLAWGGGVLVALSALLARREARLKALVEDRRTLMQERLGADDRARARLARDLHDGALQSILAVRYSLEAGTDDELSRQLSIQMLGDIAGEMRGLIGDLHPRVLDLLGLHAALASLVRRAAERSPEIRFSSELGEAGGAPGPHDDVLYRAALELVSNIGSHARATRAWIALEREGPWQVLVVEDDGVGLDRATLPARLRDGHIGLLSLVERVEGVGGTVTMGPTGGGGLTVTVRVPSAP